LGRFEVASTIKDLAPDVYVLIVVESYLPDGNEKLEFTGDLSNNPVGARFVKRQGMPLGADRTDRGK
jgi:hypothetical protein